MTCPCDTPKHPPKLILPAGLTRLPRQFVSFPEFRRAMLRALPMQEVRDLEGNLRRPLQDWRARTEGDLGVMTLEMWAYLLDVLQFYDEQTSNESYINTAVEARSLRRLAGLLGFQRRPAVASQAILAAFAEGRMPVLLPEVTAFRSGSIPGDKPHVFELGKEVSIHPLRNQWTLAPKRDLTVHGNDFIPAQLGEENATRVRKFDELLFEEETAGVTENSLVVLQWQQPFTITGGVGGFTIDAGNGENGGPDAIVTVENVGEDEPKKPFAPTTDLVIEVRGDDGDESVAFQAFQVETAETIEAVDRQTYVQVKPTTLVPIANNVKLDEVVAVSPTQRARLGNVEEPVLPLEPTPDTAEFTLTLDAVYPQLQNGDLVVVQVRERLNARRVTFSGVKFDPVDKDDEDSVPIPRTVINVAPIFAILEADLDATVVHFDMVDVGRLTAVSQVNLGPPDFTGKLTLDGVVEAPPVQPNPVRVLLEDRNGVGAVLAAKLELLAPQQSERENTAILEVVQSDVSTLPEMMAPITVYGNVIDVTRGETVRNETLGIGDTTEKFQTFPLRKGPLTYLFDQSAPNQIRSTLTVRVDGKAWTEMRSHFGQGPDAEVYVVRQNDDDETEVTFGDGITGKLLPTGAQVTATYRFGAGAKLPPPGSISQLDRPVQDVKSVRNSLPAFGGSDAEEPDELRENAPNAAALLDRAVSLQDFAAIARRVPGVVNVLTEWAFDEKLQRAAVVVWFIGDAALEADIEAALQAASEPSVPISANPATSVPVTLAIDVDAAEGFAVEDVAVRVRETLLDEDAGLLHPANVEIGRPLFRSVLLDVVMDIEGVGDVRGLLWDLERPMGVIEEPGTGGYFDFVDAGGLQVGDELPETQGNGGNGNGGGGGGVGEGAGDLE